MVVICNDFNYIFFVKILILIFSISLLAGCTSYQQTGITGGYEDVDLGGGRHKIDFQGNCYTTKERLENYNQKRAKELCPSGFKVLEEKFDKTICYPVLTTIIECK